MSTGDSEEVLAEGGDCRGGWRTAPFILGSIGGLTLAGTGCIINLIVFLINEFNVKSIDAAQINNIISGCISFFPLISAILADAFLGCFTVIWISSLVSVLGIVFLVLSVTLSSLRPPDCEAGSSSCTAPSKLQYTVLYMALGLVAVGIGGTRFTVPTMGANQFTKLKHQSTYFNWFFLVIYVASFISGTVIVYIEDNVGWGWGFGICLIANVIGLVMFLGRSRYYRKDRPQGSPFMGLARAVVASCRKWKVEISSNHADYYHGDKEMGQTNVPTNSLRFFNRAALKMEGDIHLNGVVANRWRLCTVRHVEDLKMIIKILPLWSSGIFISVPIAVQSSLTVLQALFTDRHISNYRFQIPAGSISVFALIATAIFLGIFSHGLWPLWRKVVGRHPTTLQKLGVGHILNITSMAVSALVESKRRAQQMPMSILWLVPQMVILGSGEACHFPAQLELYYREFPDSLKSLSTAMVSMLFGCGYYLSAAVVDLVRRTTPWLPNDIDKGRVDNVYWVMVGIGVLNYGYFLGCCRFYRYKENV